MYLYKINRDTMSQTPKCPPPHIRNKFTKFERRNATNTILSLTYNIFDEKCNLIYMLITYYSIEFTYDKKKQFF